ncbi:MAG: DNA alkylation repair protein [Bacteroidales bacterium]|nr:DNA alkylation repair protein [Bacteroidales bacterium]MCF8327799.1 DNA alkylation repair protein [Bacteroidales bacterium]
MKDKVIEKLKSLSEPAYKEKMSSFGVRSTYALGVRTPHIRNIAKELGQNHHLAMELWHSGIHEARMLSTMLADADQMSVEDMEQLLDVVYSWDLCDGLCFNLFYQHQKAWLLPYQWMQSEKEFTKRAGYAMIAKLALGNKTVSDDCYIDYLSQIPGYADDERSLVKKSVSWAVRQIGKRNLNLNAHAQKTAEQLMASFNKGARWAGNDAHKELKSSAVQDRLNRRAR